MPKKELTTREMIAATRSERRRKMMAELMKWVEAHDYASYEIVVHNIAPDKDAGIAESDSVESTTVAWEKALVVALALGLVEREDIPNEKMVDWEDVIMINDPGRAVINKEEKITIFGGDVVTSAKRRSQDEEQELLKLDRLLEGKSEAEQTRIIEADHRNMIELFCDPGGFYVTYNVGIALLSNDQSERRGIVAGWEILLRFKPLPQALIDAAYQLDEAGQRVGSAFHIGPRIDLATLAATRNAAGDYEYLDEDFGVWVKNSDDPEFYKPLQLEVMKGLVLGGLLPPHLCLELLTTLDAQVPGDHQPLEPVSIKLDIHKEAMLEKFKPYLDKIQVTKVDGDQVILLPDGEESTAITLDAGQLPPGGEQVLKLALLRLVENDEVTADIAFDYLKQRLWASHN